MYCTAALVTVSIAAGLLVMVSSELVVLLIVCVGINTGSAQPIGEPAHESTIIKACVLYFMLARQQLFFAYTRSK